MIKYIQRRDSHGLETVDEFDSKDFSTTMKFNKYILEMLTEYNLSDPEATHYASSKPCKAWKEAT